MAGRDSAPGGSRIAGADGGTDSERMLQKQRRFLEAPITYGGNPVEDFEVGNGGDVDARIPLKEPEVWERISGEFLPGAKLEDKCATLISMYITGKNALCGDLESSPDITDEDEDFIHICSDVARLIDEKDAGMKLPPLFFEMFETHVRAMEAGKPWESPVVAALETATEDLLVPDLIDMAKAENVPNPYGMRRTELVEELNLMLRDVNYSIEYGEDSIDEELEVRVLRTFPFQRSGDGDGDDPVQFLHIRSLSSSEEAIVPRVFDYGPELGPFFQAHSRYLEKVAEGTKFVFVTSVGSGPEQSLIFFEAKQRMDPIELRIPRRRIRDFCDALVSRTPPLLPIGDEATLELSEAIAEEVNESHASGALRATDEGVEFTQVEISEEYAYFPTTLTVPLQIRHREEFVACYASIVRGGVAVGEIPEGAVLTHCGMQEGPGSAVAVYEGDDDVTVRVLMHRIPFLTKKMTGT